MFNHYTRRLYNERQCQAHRHIIVIHVMKFYEINLTAR